MRISRLYLDQPLQPGSQLSLSGQQAHYLSKVLRLKAESPLIIFNGQGGEYSARITHINKHELELFVDEYFAVDTESPLTSILGLGLSRGERMDLAIQKSTELGVSCIVPLFTDYCEVKLKAERMGKKLRHWQQIIISACEQSGRTRIPEILAPRSLSDWCEGLVCPLKLIFEPSASTRLDQQKAAEKLALLIGPEGGFSPGELALTEQHGFVPIRLGPRVLRTETAPVAALSALQLYWGDFKL
ncbi:MAG: 16S rRNA (uracil(1498)-N(3))-methyltransferase [Gammaproteobacteria bacterium]|nr:16S rRNA (uracil(1498)-N(3))-methyltransferase [Gammaproteobacteria bacterium]MAY02573.1 16S rRNA (uracil(1498)-N(3))-methyltransferase [Gammaproteobacteria bacterium]|tara:strand:+ start:426 stop:1157 length:732 start_codon:yes stop_codon:yes gene_type:complete